MSNSLFHNGRDETQSIKNWFLASHGVQPKEMYDMEGYYVFYSY
jgi:hypothetical protein